MLYLCYFIFEVGPLDSYLTGVDMTFDLLDIIEYKFSYLFAKVEGPDNHFVDFYLQCVTRYDNIRSSSIYVDRADFINTVNEII